MFFSTVFFPDSGSQPSLNGSPGHLCTRRDYVSSYCFLWCLWCIKLWVFGRGFDRHSGRRRRSVVSSVKGDDVATAATNRNESEIHADSRSKHTKDSHVRKHGACIFPFFDAQCYNIPLLQLARPRAFSVAWSKLWNVYVIQLSRVV